MALKNPRFMNPLFIPKDFTRTTEKGREKFCILPAEEKEVRVIEYRDENGVLYHVNVWGIRREKEKKIEGQDCSVAYDEGIDNDTFRKLRGPIETMYSKLLPASKITFFGANR